MRRGKIEAWITTDHDVLPESTTKQELGRAVCWVPSKAGKAFRIGYSAVTRDYGLKVSVYIDGELAAEQTHAPPKRHRPFTLRDGVRGRKDGFGSELPFFFSKRIITGTFRFVFSLLIVNLSSCLEDNDLDIVSESHLSSLGSIQVKFAWIAVDHSSLSERPCTRLPAPTHRHHKPIFEGIVKRHSSAIAHAAGLGARRRIQPKWISLKKTRTMRNDKRRLVKDIVRPSRWKDTGMRMTTFEFKYAPAEYLQAEGILQFDTPSTSYPPTPSPNVAPTHSPWRSHVGTPYRELRADFSFSGPTPNPIRARPLLFGSDSGLNFNTPVRPELERDQMRLGAHVMTNYTPLATLGMHTIVHPVKLSPLLEKAVPLVKQESNAADDEIIEISANEYYRRDVVDLTGLDSDDE
ncbi:hypothetical protein FRC07_000210 [Ceratobasidium sp. 392]|nr:hypothetical protein FRC07_000210 [Ceratobasidium sp. 392]